MILHEFTRRTPVRDEHCLTINLKASVKLFSIECILQKEFLLQAKELLTLHQTSLRNLYLTLVTLSVTFVFILQ